MTRIKDMPNKPQISTDMSIPVDGDDGTGMVYVGDIYAAIRETVAKGDQGIQGIQGIQGERGEQGASGAPGLLVPEVIVASHILTLDDDAGVSTNSASTNLLIVPADSAVNFDIGTLIRIEQLGTGTTLIVSGGVVIDSLNGYSAISGQYGVAWLRKISANRWILSGDLGEGPELPDTYGLTYFATDAPTSAFYASITPSAIYDSVGDCTWVAYEGWNGLQRLVRVAVYNHATNLWDGPYTAFVNPLVGDDHGVPAIAMDADGYVHVIGAGHNTAMYYASTTVARDPTGWTIATALDAGSYPHPSIVGNNLYVFYRDSPGSNHGRLKRYKASISSGLLTFDPSPIAVVNTGTSTTRVYQGTHVVVGTDIHIVFSRANTADTTRQDVYYFIYNTLNDTIRNFAGTRSGEINVGRSDLDTYYRLIDQTGPNRQGNIPILLIMDGISYVTYVDGTDDSSYSTKMIISSGTSFGSPETLFQNIPGNSHRFDAVAMTESAIDGCIDIWYATDGGDGFDRGGDVSKRTRYFNGTLGSPTLVKSPERTWSLDPITAVRDGLPNLAVIFAERTTDGSTEEQQHRIYGASGDGILVKRALLPAANLNLDFTTGTYNGTTFFINRPQAVASYGTQTSGAWTSFGPSTLRRTNKGLLVEPESRNLLQRASALNSAPWTVFSVTVTANSMADADGQTTMETINKTVGSASRRIEQAITGAVNTTYTFSVNCKAGTLGTVSLRNILDGTNCVKQFNLTTGAITDVTGGPTVGGFVSASAENLGNGIWRCSLTSTSTTAATSFLFGLSPGDNGALTTGTVYVGSAQVEISSTPSSHIPTDTVAATRASDDIWIGIPADVNTLTFTFDDNTTQQITGLTEETRAAYKIPTNLNRRYVKSLVGTA